MQHCEVWASQFPFLHSLKDVVPLSEACLYGCINWSLAQAYQQSSIGLSQSLPSNRGGKARPWPWFHFTVQRRPFKSLVVPPWPRGLTWRVGLRLIQVVRSLLVVVSTSSADARRKGAWGSAFMMCQSSAFSSSSSSVIQVCILLHFLNQGRSITSYRFVLNMVQGHHLQLWSCPLLFLDFWQFNVNAAPAYQPIIQKELDELLSKGVLKSSLVCWFLFQCVCCS